MGIGRSSTPQKMSSGEQYYMPLLPIESAPRSSCNEGHHRILDAYGQYQVCLKKLSMAHCTTHLVSATAYTKY